MPGRQRIGIVPNMGREAATHRLGAEAARLLRHGLGMRGSASVMLILLGCAEACGGGSSAREASNGAPTAGGDATSTTGGSSGGATSSEGDSSTSAAPSSTTTSGGGATSDGTTGAGTGGSAGGECPPCGPCVGSNTNPIVTLVSGVDPSDLVIDAASAYWIDGSGSNLVSLMKAPLSGGTPTVLASDIGQADELAVDDTSIYWGTRTDGAIHRASLDGSNVNIVGSLGSRAGAGPNALVVDEN